MSRATLEAALGTIGVALAVGFAARWVVLGEVDGRGALLAAVGAVVLAAYAIVLGRAATEGAAHRRRVRARALARVALVAVVAVVAQRLAVWGDTAWDLTDRQLRALSSRTTTVLDALDDEVTLTAVVSRTSPLRHPLVRLLDRYASRSARVRVRTVDPRTQPAAAAELGVEGLAVAVIAQVGARRAELTDRFDEDEVTDTLVRALSARDAVVCWSEGHGELDPDDLTGPYGAGALVASLDGEDLAVRRASLLAGPPDPACDVFVLAGPRVDLTPPEAGALAAWVADGGRALVLVEPGLTPTLHTTALAPLGVRVGGVVHEPDRASRPAGAEEDTLLLVPPRRFGPHPITDPLPGAALASVAAAIAPADAPAGPQVRPLLRTSPGGRAGDDPPPADGRGVTIAVAVELGASTDRGRLVVVGDTFLASNVGLPLGSHRDLLHGAIAWLLDRPERLGAGRRTGDDLALSQRDQSLLTLLALAWVLGPLALGGAITLARRPR